MIQDIAPKKMHNEYIPQNPSENHAILVFCENKVLVKDTESDIKLPNILEAEDAICRPEITICTGCLYLFCIDHEPYFLYPDFELPQDCLKPEEKKLRFVKVSDIRYRLEREMCFTVYTAYHLYRWYRNHQYCGRCGTRTKLDGKERMIYCGRCGNQIYPVIAPAVIVAVINGDQILLTKYANREYSRYALIAGFSEIGETAEETVCREVMEEVGLHVKNIRYYKSQPWGIDGNLLFGYFADLDGDDTITMDPNELSVAEWVSREELKDVDDSFSLTREMMGMFARKNEK